MIRNLIILFVVVVAVIAGLGRYHLQSTASVTAWPVTLFHWEDPSGRATIEQAMRVTDFRPAPNRRQNFGYTESAHWFRFRLAVDSVPQELSLEIKNHTIHHVELFAVQNGRAVSLGKTGNWQPFRERPSPTKTFVYPIYAEPGKPATYYLRLDKRHDNLATEITLRRTADFENENQRAYFLWGIFVGTVGLIVLLNLIFWRLTRDRVYLWYGVYLLGLSLRQAADTGLGFQYLWPDVPLINHPDALIESLWLYLPAMLQFQQHFLDLRRESRRVYQVSQVLKWTFLGAFGGLVILQLLGVPRWYWPLQQLVPTIHTVLGNTIILTFIAVVWVGLRSTDTLKKLYAVGVALQVFGQLFVITQNLMRNRADGVFFVDAYLILTGIFFIDLVVFAYLLAYRYRNSVTDNRQLQISLARAQQDTNRNVIDMLEAERRQVSELLISDVGHRLAEARTVLSGVTESPALTNSHRLIAQADSRLASIARNSLPAEFAEKGLAGALAELVQQANTTRSTQFTFTQTGEGRSLTASEETQLYRIAGELVTNVLKHAGATQAQVRLLYKPDAVQLIVDDNGTGFDATKTVPGSGIGLQNLHARAAELKADLRISSTASGTSVRLTVPLKIQTS